MWWHILGLYLVAILGLIVLVVVQAKGPSRLLLPLRRRRDDGQRRDGGRRPFWVLIWRWVRYVARCGRRRKKRAKPADDRREERRALRKQLREEAEEWLAEWVERIVELGDDLLEVSFDDDDDDDDDLLLGDGAESSDEGSGDAKERGPADDQQAVYGLVNTGNSCFFNSVLQALASAEYLQNYLSDTLEHMDEVNDVHDAAVVSLPLTEALWETLTDLNAVVGRDSAFQPFAVMAALGSRGLNDREQQDAQEAFQVLSTALSEERLAFAGLQTPSLLRADLAAMLAQIDERRPHVFSVPRGLEGVGTKGLSRVKAIMKLATLAGLPAEGQGLTFGRRAVLQNPFTGLMASRLSCVRCGYTEAVRHFAFDNVSLSLPLTATCTLEQTLREYISLEEIVDYQCRKCSLGQTLRELIADIKCATSWLAEHPEYGIGGSDAGPATESGGTATRSQRRAARAAVAWKRMVLDGTRRPGSSSSESGSSCDSDSDGDDDSGHRSDATRRRRRARMYPIDPATLQVGPRPGLPAPQLVDVPGIIRRLREDAHEVARALRVDVQRHLPDIPLRRAHNQACTKQVAFAKLPPCLCLHLSRSTYTSDGYPVKNPCHVRFPEYLDFSPYTTTGHLRVEPEQSIIDAAAQGQAPRHPGGAPASHRAGYHPSRRVRDALEALGPGADLQRSYRLQAVVVHIGTHSHGHFITYRRKPRPPTRSGVNTPRYRSGSAVSLPAPAAAPSSHALDRRLTPAAPSAPLESSDGVRRRRIVGGSADSRTYVVPNGSEPTDGLGPEYLPAPALKTRPKRAWRVTDAMTAEWYLISDEDVQVATLAEVLNANPYLLIYERVDGPQPAAYTGTPGIIPSLSNLRSLARRSASVQPPPPPAAQPAELSPGTGPAYTSDTEVPPLTLGRGDPVTPEANAAASHLATIAG
ncbi:ubiquitin-specific protease ubp1 [Coemansia biformis]|uniref:Ubiquitin carboxyl-terminal hydrolase n=1 Tax=Coemansia biformis TaxID=1286918 RepID=A0A9W7YFB7_9FUNG|nr:ubiquitin-specific protease ubp1 [Coemansia biformis]